MPVQTFSRASNPYPKMSICYDGVYYWLFKAGFVSLRCLFRDGLVIDAMTANTILGNGMSLTRNSNATVPAIARMLINFRGNQNDTKNTCHWVVSLGNGNAIGVNNGGGGTVDGKTVNIDFASGSGSYGVFKLQQVWDVYTGVMTHSKTSGKSGCTVAVIDPSAIPNRITGSN